MHGCTQNDFWIVGAEFLQAKYPSILHKQLHQSANFEAYVSTNLKTQKRISICCKTNINHNSSISNQIHVIELEQKADHAIENTTRSDAGPCATASRG